MRQQVLEQIKYDHCWLGGQQERQQHHKRCVKQQLLHHVLKIDIGF